MLICATKESGAKAQVLLDIVQSSKACLQESAAPHIWHAGKVAILRWCRISYVGIDSLAKCHKNTRILLGTCVCQRDDQLLLSSVLDGPSVPYSQFSRLSFVFWIMRYAERTVKFPFFSLLQAQKSSTLLVHKGILSMAFASMGIKTVRTRSTLHVDVVWSISSCTRVGGLATNEVIGLKTSCRGIQLCSQIIVLSHVPILLMTPYFIISLPSIIER